jgi:hypothetical protein
MNKTPFDRPSNSEDELLPEYRFDYKKAKPIALQIEVESQS